MVFPLCNAGSDPWSQSQEGVCSSMAFHTPSTTKNKTWETKEMAFLTQGLLNQSVMGTVRSAFLLYFILAPSIAVLSYRRTLPLLLFWFEAVPRYLDRVGHVCVFMWDALDAEQKSLMWDAFHSLQQWPGQCHFLIACIKTFKSSSDS